MLFLILLHLCEALAAIYRSVLSGFEGDLSLIAAGSAGSCIHLSAFSGSVLSRITASLAALGLIYKAFLCIELLLACSENEFVSAVLTY